MHPSDFENKCFLLNICLLSGLFQTGRVQTKAETVEQNMRYQESKQQEFILRIARVHSWLERGVNEAHIRFTLSVY